MIEDGKIPEEEIEALRVADADAEDAAPKDGKGLLGNSEDESKKGGVALTCDIGAIAMTLLSGLLDDLAGGNEQVGFEINNHTKNKLHKPKYYIHSGHVGDSALEIPSDMAGLGYAYSKWGTAGTVGLLSYKIDGTSKRLVAMWSIPHNRVLYKNWFKFATVGEHDALDNNLWKDMYYNKGKTSGKCAPADAGSESWESNGFKMEGNMSTGQRGIIRLNFSR